MTARVSGPTLFDMVDGFVAGADLYAMLVASTFTFNRNQHEYRSSVVGELVGDGYISGGVLINNVEIIKNDANHSIDILGEDPFFGLVTLTDISTVVIYMATGLATTDRILSAVTYDTPIDLTADYFYHVWEERNPDDDTQGLIARYNY